MRMCGYQLVRQWEGIQVIEANPNWLTVAEPAKREETGLRPIYRDLEAFQVAGFPLYTEEVDRANRCSSIATNNFKIPKLFNQLNLSGKIAKRFLNFARVFMARSV